MDQHEVDAAEDERGAKTVWGEPSPGAVYAARARQVLQRAAGSGALAGASGGLTVLSGLRALSGGKVLGGLARLVVGVVLLGVAAVQRQATTRPRGERIDIEGPGEQRAGRESTAPLVTIDEGPYDRLGAAAFDEYSSEVPVPQKALNLNLMTLGSEVIWGVRDADDAVLLAADFDAVQDRAGVDYVGSSELDDDRMLDVPDRIRTHWDELAGGPVAVESGTELVFATSEHLREDGIVLLVPEQWVDEVLGGEEE